MGCQVGSLDTKTKELFLSIAHQWRQPLSGINSIVGAIDNRLYELQLDDKVLHQHLLEIEKLTKYMSDTIEDFKIDYIEVTKEEAWLLSELVTQTLELVAQNFQDSAIELELDLDVKSHFSGDAKLLKQILLIFLNNAKDALIERNVHKPKLFIKVCEDTNSFFIHICDNAGGISKSIREKIFEKNFTTKHDSEGTGLGLFMCKEHIENTFKGSLNVNNRADGVCFDIILPKE